LIRRLSDNALVGIFPSAQHDTRALDRFPADVHQLGSGVDRETRFRLSRRMLPMRQGREPRRDHRALLQALKRELRQVLDVVLE
jgi:hypothetical protein